MTGVEPEPNFNVKNFDFIDRGRARLHFELPDWISSSQASFRTSSRNSFISSLDSFDLSMEAPRWAPGPLAWTPRRIQKHYLYRQASSQSSILTSRTLLLLTGVEPGFILSSQIEFQAHRLHFGARPESRSFPHRIQLICRWKLPDELQGLSLEPIGASKNVTFINKRRFSERKT